jgi:4-nitrophenyl phosphatase
MSTLQNPLLTAVDSFLLDLDGVLFEGGKPIPGSREAILALRAAGKRIFCVTNNAARTRQQVAAKIEKIVNVPIAESEVVTSAWAAAAALKVDLASGQKVYACGEEGLFTELANAGVAFVTTPYEQRMSEGDFEQLANGGLDPDVAAVCLGFDSSFTYAKLCIASLYIQRGARFYCTNTDAYNKVGGARMPRTGCLLDSLQRAVGQEATVVGKPSGKFMDLVVDRYELDRSRTLMVGDRLDTDIEFGNQNGVQTCLVLSGVSSQADVDVLQDSDVQIPNYVRADLQALLLA